MNNLYLTFSKELIRRGYSRKEIRSILRDIRPFFEYVVHVNKHGLCGIESEHVRAYAAKVKASHPAGMPYAAALDVNGKICALKIFCLQMAGAGKLPRDYADDIGFIELQPMPDLRQGATWTR